MQVVKWKQNRVLINHFSPEELLDVFIEMHEEGQEKQKGTKSIDGPCVYAMCVNAVPPTHMSKSAPVQIAQHAHFLYGVCIAAVCSAAFRIWQTKYGSSRA